MGIFDFVKNAGRAIGIGHDETPQEQDQRAAEAKAASEAARARAQSEATAKASQAAGAASAAAGGIAHPTGGAATTPTTTSAGKAAPGLTEAALQAKIKSSKIVVKDLSLKIDGEDKVKIYGVVTSADDKTDLILVVGNTPGVAKVEDAIKVRKPGSDKDEDSVPAPKLHQVRDGDTLSSIAQKELGDANRYMEIFNANRNILHDPDAIDVGQTLRIPSK